MRLFWKVYLWSLAFTVMAVAALATVAGFREADRLTRLLRQEQRLYAAAASSQIEAGYYEETWPFEMLATIAGNENFVCWHIVDGAGHVILSDCPAEEDDDHHHEVVMESMSPVLREPALAGSERPGVETWVVPMRMRTGTLPWTFHLGFHNRTVREQIRSLILHNSLLALGIAVILVPVALVVTRRTLAPLHSLTRAADALKTGALDVSLPPPTHDEIGQLVAAFDAMVRSVKVRDAEIQEKVCALADARDRLEERVHERTAELSRANETLKREIAQREQAEEALQQANTRLEELITTDDLTALANRRGFMEAIDLETERARRYRSDFALAMIDVDGFKAINDACGHVFGDRVLVEVARALEEGTRATDLVARYGGDEITILMPNTDAQAAVSAVERICRRIAGRVISDGQRSLQVTISAGISALDSKDRTAGPDLLIRQADEALYAAKHAGGNVTKT